ncbi:APC family permease [Planctomicrobium sp. SH664]|uniref:APC family permease n=1 Tax=Planctomicrobium sp. SH664 TaxID=3448125 RepID=UPI003F5C0F90
MQMTDDVTPAGEQARRPASLGLWDTISLIVGIVVGVSIFKVPPAVFARAGSPEIALGFWLFGAFLALCGALCYCELVTTYPEFGAEYVFLTRAYGRRTGFLFVWMQTCAVMTGSIGIMSFFVADYAEQILPPGLIHPAVIAATAVAALVGVHAFGLQTGRWVQNLLTVLKIVSLAALLICGLLLPTTQAHAALVGGSNSVSWADWGLALVFVLYAYGGWNDAATIMPEVRDGQRNMPRALILGLGSIAVLYLAMNCAYLRGLGFDAVKESTVPAADLIEQTLSARFAWLISLIVIISALGGIHGMLFAGCRLLAAVGKRESYFRAWNRWNKNNVPLPALFTLGAVSLLLIGLVGTQAGRDRLTALAGLLHFPAPDWKEYGGGFNLLLSATAPIFWGFFALSGSSLIVLRWRDPQRPRPFRVPLYPLTPLVFVSTSLYMCWSSLQYAGQLTILALPVFLVGVAISLLPARAALGSPSEN